MCYGEVLVDKSIMYIRVTLYCKGTGLDCDYFIWCVSCTVVISNCFVLCGCFDKCVVVLIIGVLVFTVFCIVSFRYIYSYLLYMY